MTKNERIYQRYEMEAMRKIHPNLDHMPVGGLKIQQRPAFTQIDPDRAGDFVLLTVRDPLCVYEKDPAEQIADRPSALGGPACSYPTPAGTRAPT